MNDQFRLCFVWSAAGPKDVECVDYHFVANRLAQAIGVPTNRITELVGERRAMTADTASRTAIVGLGFTIDYASS